MPCLDTSQLERTSARLLQGVETASIGKAPCDLGDPGWGIPGSAWCFCCFTHPLVWPGSVDVFLVRLAWILQHAATLLPMAGDIQAVLNSHTAGVSDIHAWGLMLPSSSRVSPVTYHSVVAVRYPDLCRLINDMWELGSFASGGLPDRPPGFQFVLWDTNARINGLVATDLETLVSEVLSPFPRNAGFPDGLFVMTTATDHKNNLNRSVLKKDYARTLRVETIANSAGGTARVAIVAQPSIGFH